MATPPAEEAFPSRRIALRRDGRRPLVLDGALVAAARLDEPDGARVELNLLRDVAGGLALQIRRLSADQAARPYHAALPLAAPDDLEAALRRGVASGELPTVAETRLRRLPPTPIPSGDTP